MAGHCILTIEPFFYAQLERESGEVKQQKVVVRIVSDQSNEKNCKIWAVSLEVTMTI